MAQYVMSMLRVSKIVPPKRQIIKDISLSFFPGAKIGLLGLNGSGKSTVLRIMAGVDKEYGYIGAGFAAPLSDDLALAFNIQTLVGKKNEGETSFGFTLRRAF